MDNEAANRIRQEIEKLVKSYSDLRKFKNDKEIAAISEANVRADYIDRLFGILGWNTSNPDEYDREHFIRGAGFADVALILNKKPVIFIEAKRFGGIAHSKDIKGDWTFEERQSILYAVSKNCKWAILTNFEKFRVFNALTGLTILNFESVFDYKDRFNDLLYLTKDYVESGRIEKLGAREEKQDIDLEFLDLLNKWRIELANDIYRNNFLNEGKPPDLSKLFPNYEKYEKDPKMAKFFESRREILRKRLDFSVLKDEKGNFDIERLKSAVQRILDRLIIIRWAEDRLLLDDPNILEGKLKLWKTAARYNPLYEALFADGALFDKFNDIHNGELFKRGLFYDRVTVSDGVLARIIEEMTLHSFRKFDFDILGNTYETYLGNTLYLKEDNTFELRPSQETRKQSGIYYTPPYVVDYIVKNTLGALLKDKKPEEVAHIKVLDPACGSGSFLIKAYDCFANYYEERNREIEARIAEMMKTGKITENFEGKHSGYEASILLNNIHGVDLDSQAAEIAAVNLMLKVLKAEEMLPPILGETIKVGNSLISGREEELKKYFGEEWRAKKPFNWEEEFADVFDKSLPDEERGFDVVIGNPPYVRQEVITGQKNYFENTFTIFDSAADLYAYFIEQSIKKLKNQGLFSFIVSNKFTRAHYGKNLRKFILENCKILQFIDFGDLPVFEDATAYPCIIIMQKENNEKLRNENTLRACKIENLDFKELEPVFQKNSYFVKQMDLGEDGWSFEPIEIAELRKKINKKGIHLKEYAGEPLSGIKTGLNEVLIVDEEKIQSIVGENGFERELFKPIIRGRDIKRWNIQFEGKYLIFTENKDINKYPNTLKYLSQFKNELSERSDIKGTNRNWFGLRACDYYDQYEKPKIVYPDISNECNFSYDEKGYFIEMTGFIIPKADKYLAAILNSKLVKFYFSYLSAKIRGDYYRFKNIYVNYIPIHAIDFSNPSEKSVHDEFVVLVDRMLSLNKQLSEINSEFLHYLNLRPHSMVLLRNFMDALPVGDKEVLKDAFGRKPVSAIKAEKFEAFEILEEGEWLVFKVAYLYKSSKGKIERGSITRALRLHIPDNIMRKFILYNLKDTTPGKLGSGNILEQLQKLKIPRLVTNGEENRRAIEELMAPFLIGIAKKEAIEQEIKVTDDAINKKVYSLYGLTTDEIKIIEENR
jgi:type I restriction-modification system DNA methylase subunit